LPAEFLLPLFAVTLLANAILVAFAVRGMRRGQWDAHGPFGSGRPPTGPSARAAAPIEVVRSFDPGPRTEPARPAEPPRPAEPARPADVREPDADTADPPPVADAGPADRRSSGAASKRRRTTKKPAAAARPRPAEPRRARRRFSLPPLDDDHEKVNRSIESFLGGADLQGVGPDGADASTGGVSATGASTSEPPAGPTTVALIALDGLPVPLAGRLHPPTPHGARDPADNARDEALALVERTLRGAARTTDAVTVIGPGRFRIVLPATGELAARAYLRRVRATIEPGLDVAGSPLRLAVATATALDEPLSDAIRRAEDRLAAGLRAARSEERDTRLEPGDGQLDDADDEQRLEPRAAGD
jgi:hypothetical protein